MRNLINSIFNRNKKIGFGHLIDHHFLLIGKVVYYHERMHAVIRQVMYSNHPSEKHDEEVNDVSAKDLIKKFHYWLKDKTPNQLHSNVDYFNKRLKACNTFRNDLVHSMSSVSLTRINGKIEPILYLLKSRSDKTEMFQLTDKTVSFELVYKYLNECQIIYEQLCSILSTRQAVFNENGFITADAKIKFNQINISYMKQNEFDK